MKNYHVMGVIDSCNFPRLTSTGDGMISFVLVDPTGQLPVNLFYILPNRAADVRSSCPLHLSPGTVLLLHNIRFGLYQGRPQGTGRLGTFGFTVLSARFDGERAAYALAPAAGDAAELIDARREAAIRALRAWYRHAQGQREETPQDVVVRKTRYQKLFEEFGMRGIDEFCDCVVRLEAVVEDTALPRALARVQVWDGTKSRLDYDDGGTPLGHPLHSVLHLTAFEELAETVLAAPSGTWVYLRNVVVKYDQPTNVHKIATIRRSTITRLGDGDETVRSMVASYRARLKEFQQSGKVLPANSSSTSSSSSSSSSSVQFSLTSYSSSSIQVSVGQKNSGIAGEMMNAVSPAPPAAPAPAARRSKSYKTKVESLHHSKPYTTLKEVQDLEGAPFKFRVRARVLSVEPEEASSLLVQAEDEGEKEWMWICRLRLGDAHGRVLEAHCYGEAADLLLGTPAKQAAKEPDCAEQGMEKLRGLVRGGEEQDFLLFSYITTYEDRDEARLLIFGTQIIAE